MAKFSKISKHLMAATAVAPTAIGIGADISNGKGVVSSVASGIASFAVTDAIAGLVGGPAGWAMLGIDIAAAVGDMAVSMGRENTQNVKKNMTGFGKVGNGSFADNQYGATMRERSLNAIGGHQAMSRSVLGSEARRRASTVSY